MACRVILFGCSVLSWLGCTNDSSTRQAKEDGAVDIDKVGRQVSKTEVITDSTGKPQESHHYDLHGNLIYIGFYTKADRPNAGVMMPVFEARDTVVWGNNYTGSIRFGYPLTTPAMLLIGRLGEDQKAIDRYPLLDTLSIVAQSPDGRFYFSYRPPRAGANKMSYKFYQPKNQEADTLSVNNLSSSHSFFVEKQEN